MLFFRCEVECGVGEFEGGDFLQHLLAEVAVGIALGVEGTMFGG